jgi:hypothetical protein
MLRTLTWANDANAGEFIHEFIRGVLPVTEQTRFILYSLAEEIEFL